MVSLKGTPFVEAMTLTCVRWAVASPLRSCQGEERMRERGVPVDHATINRWAVQSRARLEAACHRRQRPAWRRGRLDEAYTRVRGHWCDLYRASAQRCSPDGAAGRAGGQALPDQGAPPPRGARDDGQGWQ